MSRKITQGFAEVSVSEASMQYVIDAYYKKYPEQLKYEAVIPLDIESLNIHDEYLITFDAPRGPQLKLAAVSDAEAAARKAARLRFPLPPEKDDVSSSGETNCELGIDGINFAVYKYEKGQKGDLIQSLVVNARMFGFVCVANNVIQVAGLDGEVTVGSGQPQPDPIAGILLKVLATALKDRFDDCPLPQLQGVMGAYPVINKASIKNKRLVCEVAVDITGAQPITGGLFGADSVEAAGPVEITGWAQELIVNELSDAFIVLPQFKEGGTAESGGFGIRAGVFVGVESPRLKIAGGVATASANAGAWAEVGVQVCGEWVDVRVTAGKIEAKVDIKTHISSDGHQGYITFEPDINSIKFVFGLDLPVPFRYVLSPITLLLDSLVSAIAKSIYKAYADVKLPVIVLGSSMDVFSVPLTFKVDKFQFDGDKVAFSASAQ